MSRLDQHVASVQLKLMLAMFVRLLVWAGLALAGAIFLVILVERIFNVRLPHRDIFLWIGVGLMAAVPLAVAIVRRPSSRQAAVAIDERLGLQEKFSTALYVRGSADPFVVAAVRDAEQSASSVNLRNQFSIPIPKRALVKLAVGVIIVFCAQQWFPELDVLDHKGKQAHAEQQRKTEVAHAQRNVRDVLAQIEAAPPQVAENEQIKLAHQELSKMLEKQVADAPQLTRKAQDVLKEIQAVKERIKAAGQYATIQQEMANLRNVTPPAPEEVGPIADAQRALAAGKVDEAIEQLKKTADKFDQMDKKEQEKAAEQMKNLANEIAKQAGNPKVQQQIQNQLQNAGVSKDQAQQMTNLMQQAANGNQQASQQLQKMAKQAIQQANGKGGMSQQQQQAMAQAIQQAVQQGQQKSNGQASAQQMAQAAQGLASAMAMQQGAGQQGAGKGGQGGHQAQANGQQGQQGGQQGQPGQQPGQQGQSGQSARQQMQQQIAQLQAMAKDAQAVAAGQQGQDGGADQGQGAEANAQNPGGQEGQGQGQGEGNGQKGNPMGQQGQPGGQGGNNGHGGAKPALVDAPFQIKRELDPSQINDRGKILASTFIKAPADRGSSKIELSKAIESEAKDAADEVPEDRIPRSARQAVKEYFDTIKSSPPQ